MSLSRTFSVLSDANRRKILDLLKVEEMSVSQLTENFDVTMPTLSHHLDALKSVGLVSGRREGQQIIYSLNLSVFEEIAEAVAGFLDARKVSRGAAKGEKPKKNPK